MENYIIANATHKGQVREVNEDSMITFDSPNGRIVAVCDGMGGMAAGDVASQLACAIIQDILTNNTFESPEEAITKSIMAANQGILHRTSQDTSLTGMGATCVMLIIKDGKVTYGWVGDSRIYYIANHTIRQISKDQSFVQALVDAGQLTPEEAEHHPRKNEITNALGVQGMTPPVIGSTPIEPAAGSVFLLCSDGLSGMVDNEHIKRIVCHEEMTLSERANRLVAAANANGGLDNITVQLVQFNGEGVIAAKDVKSRSTSKGIFIGALSTIAVLAVGAVVAWQLLLKPEPPKPSITTKPSNNINMPATERPEKPKVHEYSETTPKEQEVVGNDDENISLPTVKPSTQDLGNIIKKDITKEDKKDGTSEAIKKAKESKDPQQILKDKNSKENQTVNPTSDILKDKGGETKNKDALKSIDGDHKKSTDEGILPNSGINNND